MVGRAIVATGCMLVVLAIGLAVGRAGGAVSSASARVTVVHTDESSACADTDPATRDPANPLMLSADPGPDPLNGAQFFVDGPAHGAAAGAIARLLGIDTNVPAGAYLPAFADDESWATFQQYVAQQLAKRASDHQLVYDIRMLEKIADEPEAQRVSAFSEGGGPGAIADFTRKLFCHNFTADPGTIPIITTYLLHPALGGCATASQIEAAMPTFKRRVDELVAGTGNRPVVYLLEIDAIGSSSCMARSGGLGAWEAALRYEVDQMATLPHAVVYLEAGYSDSNSPQYTASALNAADVSRIRGFYTNDTHENWTSNEVVWAEKVSALTHGAHYIVDTADNGDGPLLNSHPTTEGVEDLCNPPGRALGPRPTTDTGSPHADAFLWEHVPGASSGSCNGGPPAGTFWTARAIGEAARANGRLGPNDPSQPY